MKQLTLFSIFCITLLLISGCASVTPYDSEFSCPPTYSGKCESLEDAYLDSVAGIDPKKYDKKWIEKRKKWEKKNKSLIEARKKAGIPVKTVTPPEELFKDKKNKTSQTNESKTSETSEKVSFEQKEEIQTEKGRENEPLEYRDVVLKKMADLIESPETPFILPPKVVRILVLSSIFGDGLSQMYVSYRYIYFFLDGPRFIFHKYAEPLSIEKINPFVIK